MAVLPVYIVAVYSMNVRQGCSPYPVWWRREQWGAFTGM